LTQSYQRAGRRLYGFARLRESTLLLAELPVQK